MLPIYIKIALPNKNNLILFQIQLLLKIVYKSKKIKVNSDV